MHQSLPAYPAFCITSKQPYLSPQKNAQYVNILRPVCKQAPNDQVVPSIFKVTDDEVMLGGDIWSRYIVAVLHDRLL